MTQIRNIRKMYIEKGKNISQIARENSHDLPSCILLSVFVIL